MRWEWYLMETIIPELTDVESEKNTHLYVTWVVTSRFRLFQRFFLESSVENEL